MYKSHTVGVVVPAYNEEPFIESVLETIPDYVDRVYVVDDGSTDDTWGAIHRALETVAETASHHPSARTTTDGGAGRTALSTGPDTAFDRRIVPIRHAENRGVGGAIKTGYMHALEDGIDVTAVMGGDGQMDPEFLPRLLDPIVDGTVDYTKGNRLLHRTYREGMPPWRFFGNSILTFLTKIASGYWKMMDPQNGYTAISGQALQSIDLEGLYEYYGYCNDLLVKLNASGMRVGDVAIPAQYGEENSSIEYPTYIRKVSGMLLRNFAWRLKTRYLVLDFHPLALFYAFGSLIGLLGSLGVAWSIYAWQRLETPLFIRFALSSLLFITGSLFLLFAMLFDMQANEDREVQLYD